MADIGANSNVESTVAPIVVPASGLWWVQFFVFMSVPVATDQIVDWTDTYDIHQGR